MSRIDDLIAERCPRGVEFKTLGEVGTTYAGLTGKTKADFAAGNARFVSYVNVFNNEATNVEPGDRVAISVGERQNRVERGDVLFTASSESAEEVGMSSVVTKTPPDPLYLNSFCFGFRQAGRGLLDNDFAKHLFRSPGVRRQIVRTANGVTRFNVSKARFVGVRIPIPPIGVQREIARILDSFSQLEAELEGQLEAEREARMRQYPFYRDQLLAFADKDSVRSVIIGEVVTFVNGKPHERLVDPQGDIALMTSKFISTQGASARYVRAADVLTPAHKADVAMVMSDLPNGRALARTFFVDDENRYAANQRVCLLRTSDPGVLAPRFLHYIANRNNQLLAYDSGVDQTHLKKGDILGISIPLPPMAEQQRVVGILDKLDGLVNDLCVGLSAELTARRKQYEYYRDRLLSFDEAPA